MIVNGLGRAERRILKDGHHGHVQIKQTSHWQSLSTAGGTTGQMKILSHIFYVNQRTTS
jgi:hypothetical protein